MTVKRWKRAVRNINNIAAWLWEDRAPVTAAEERETLRLVQEIIASIERTFKQIEQFPEIGQSRRERKRRIVITGTRYVMFCGSDEMGWFGLRNVEEALTYVSPLVGCRFSGHQRSRTPELDPIK